MIIQQKHPIVNKKTLQKIEEMNKSSFQMIPLLDYLKKNLKVRGSGTGTLNSHTETMIERDLTEKSLEDSKEPIALSIIGNKFQRVHAVVQGFNPKKPDSGFERPVLEEGPHMVIGLYAKDYYGNLHIFRTLQMRTGRLIVDTPRGFADATMLENGEQIYSANSDQLETNLFKIMKEETGNLKIKKITYLGADICNTSCIISKSALYAVEINYAKFRQFSGIITDDEYTRRIKQLQHEGLIGGIVDMTVAEYLLYKNNPNITKDMTADYISDLIVMNHLNH